MITKPTRQSLPQAFREAVYKLQKDADRLHRLVYDGRFPTKAGQIIGMSASDLARAVQTLHTADPA